MSMIEANLGTRTRRSCGWMTKEQDMQTRHFMGVLIGQDTIAYSLSEDGQELTLYTDDTPTMTMTRIGDDILKESSEQTDEAPELTASAYAAAAEEYVSISISSLPQCLENCKHSPSIMINFCVDGCYRRFPSL